jgi:hypothetical protein
LVDQTACGKLHNHSEVDERLIKLLKSSEGKVQVQPDDFLERFHQQTWRRCEGGLCNA